ncbi:phospholipase D-like domain-containing protein [Fundidesulfovibrio magnetotacticus]|nr:phospholipase D-like domain-containing protein [Fundidesulfovibrio magnetotacticus]
MNGINGHYLQYIIDNDHGKTEEVLAAVAYATQSSLLFDWCWNNKIPLTFYGRLDDGIAVSSSILDGFIKRRSQRYICRLVQHHHAKVIWWKGSGLYIGSANLSGSAWYSNVETGCFFDESEITDEMANDIDDLFQLLQDKSTPLTDELFNAVKKRERALHLSKPNADEFWGCPAIKKWSGLVQTAPKSAKARQRSKFLDEWHSTLQELRDIGDRISKEGNRPAWVHESTPRGAQVDQFLHAHYYNNTFDGRNAKYNDYYIKNKDRKENALDEAIHWWSRLPNAPHGEDVMLNDTGPALMSALSKESLASMTIESFAMICGGVHAIKDYARRVDNHKVGLPSGGQYTVQDKVDALSKMIWSDVSLGGYNVCQVIDHVLYGGSPDHLPERIWDAVTDPKWKIRGLAISSFGELVGWALPDRFPPRNGRTSKALKSLGYDVTIHAE